MSVARSHGREGRQIRSNPFQFEHHFFRPDGGEIRISRGGVETTLGGETTTLNENEFATVNGSKLSARERLLAPPRLSSPANSEQIVDSTGGGVTVNFSWLDPDGNPAASFYIQIAKSSTFVPDSIMVDRSGMAARDFRLTGLSPGAYYWRVKATARSGQTTNWSDPSRFIIVRNSGNIAIDATEWKVEGVGGGIYFISGRTQPGMTVRAAARETFAASDGTFKLQINSVSTEANVEIGDDRGNRGGFVISLRSGNLLRRY